MPPPRRISGANRMPLGARRTSLTSTTASSASSSAQTLSTPNSAPALTNSAQSSSTTTDQVMSTLFGGAGNAANSGTSNTTGDLSKDEQVTNPPEDSISSLAFSGQSDHLAVASWDKKVRIYEIDQQGKSKGVALFEHEGPVLGTAWSKDGQKVFGAGADKAARMLDLGGGNTSNATQVAAHDLPISCISTCNVNNTEILITGSWDKTIKYWDLRQQTPVATLQCQDRVYTMDTRNDMLVVGTAERYINVVNLQNPGTIFKTIQSPLKWQTRVVSTFADAQGFAVGSIEGRCAIQYTQDKDASLNFSFKCHRETPPNVRDVSNVYSVNAISFHPEHGTFSTAGSDGTFHFWDKDAKHRLKGYPNVGGTISATDFSKSGNIFAYAVSYDWSKGYAFNTPGLPNKIMLHPIAPDECKPRPNSKKR